MNNAIKFFFSITLMLAIPSIATAETQICGVLSENEVWDKSHSPYLIDCDLKVKKELKIEAGVEVKVAKDVHINVFGTLQIMGTEQDRVSFFAVKPNDKWAGIFLQTNDGGIATINYADIADANTGLSVQCCHGVTGDAATINYSSFKNINTVFSGYSGSNNIVIRNSLFENNGTVANSADKVFYNSIFKNNQYGLYQTERISVYNSSFSGHEIALWGGRGKLENCTIDNNETGIQAFFEGFELTKNSITENDIGVIVGEYDGYTPPIKNNHIVDNNIGIIFKGHGDTIENNDIYQNTTFNAKNDHQSDVTTRNNWWGSVDLSMIDDKNHDELDDSSLGRIIIASVLSQSANDEDADGITDLLDNCQSISNVEQEDFDTDGIGDVCDNDRDGDNQANTEDAFPDDPSESLDTDADGTGDNADLDDDNDNLPDSWEIMYGLNPKDANDASTDLDNDGVSNHDEYKFNTIPNDATSLPKLQQVSISSCSRVTIDSEVRCDIRYTTSNNNANLSGIGFRLHYDTSKLEWVGFEDIIQDALFAADDLPSNDSADDDQDELTTKYINTGWTNVQGQWPSKLPAKLFTAKFKVKDNVEIGDTSTMRFSSTGTANGYTFVSKPHTITIVNACTFDIDNDGQLKPLTDGLLILRYLFNFRGKTLVDDIVGFDATRQTAIDIEQYLEGCVNDFDIDGNEVSEPLTDGLLVLRYLFGFRNNALIDEAIGTDAVRNNAASVTEYMKQRNE